MNDPAYDYLRYAGSKKRKSETWMQVVVGILAVVVLLVICTLAGRAFYHWKYAPDMNLPSLVNKVQGDIQKINDNAKKMGWEVDEAEVEVNFIAKDSSNNTTELKAASSEIGSEREDSQRLLLKLHRIQTSNSESLKAPTALAVPPKSPKTKE